MTGVTGLEPGAGLTVLARLLRSGDLSLDEHLLRLEVLVRAREPVLQALLPEEGRFERLRREAGALLERYPEPARRPPLFGVPVGVKDIFRADGFPVRAGSRLPPELFAGPEAMCVTALKRAGALVLAKTATTEFAYFAPGPTRNPRAPEHTPGGSSSGSAAAVAAGYCPLALGTQTGGSIIRPAAFCGVVGFKPSYGRIPMDCVIPLAPSLDHVGVLTTDVESAMLAASLLCPDWDAGRLRPAGRGPGGTPVLAVPVGPYLSRAAEDGLGQLAEACRRLADAGYEVRELPALADFEEIEARHRMLLAAEAARVHAAWFERFGELYHPRTAALIERGRGVSDEELSEAVRGRERLRRELALLMDDQGLDAWISPAARGAAPRGLDSTGDPVMNLPWTYCGVPALAVPAGLNADGLPVGVQITARWYQDETLLAWGAGIDRALRS
ncbi:MAG: amidase [Gemmatimonadetes bacterium]|nr:amidase [Gemmatimonadota bacterium]